jgi:uncharacterized protein
MSLFSGRLGEARHSWVEWFKLAIPLVLVVMLVFGVTWHFVQPAPPHRIVMAAGMPGGVYDSATRSYAAYFAENGFELVVKPSAGSIENYQMLLDPHSGVDVALVQGGTAPAPDQRPHLRAICSVYFEPLWIFHRSSTPITHLTDLAGKRLGIGPTGSGGRALAERVLHENGIATGADAATVISDQAGPAAAAALASGRLDAVFLVSGPENPVIQQLIQTPGIRLMSLQNAEAYARRMGFLSRVDLFEGSLDLAKDLPQQDVELVAPAAIIVARDTTHTAIVELLVQAAKHVHGSGTLLNEPGLFPSANYVDVPMDSDAVHFLKIPQSFLHRTLPFWVASLVDRLLILLLPSIAVLLPLLKLTPIVYRWRMRSRIYRWYTQLRLIDARQVGAPSAEQLKADRDELQNLDRELARVKVPLSFMQELYDLRLHVAYLSDTLRPAQTAAKPPEPDTR